jgi:formylmethanofuran dehydrogenase subunit E
MYYSNDPIADYSRYDAERQKEEESLPKCDICGEPIQDDYLYDLDGNLVCEECLIDNFKKPVDNYIDM